MNKQTIKQWEAYKKHLEKEYKERIKEWEKSGVIKEIAEIEEEIKDREEYNKNLDTGFFSFYNPKPTWYLNLRLIPLYASSPSLPKATIEGFMDWLSEQNK